MVAEANEEFRTLNLSIDEMVSGNNSNAEESTNISSAMIDVVDSAKSLKIPLNGLMCFWNSLAVIMKILQR